MKGDGSLDTIFRVPPLLTFRGGRKIKSNFIWKLLKSNRIKCRRFFYKLWLRRHELFARLCTVGKKDDERWILIWRRLWGEGFGTTFRFRRRFERFKVMQSAERIEDEMPSSGLEVWRNRGGEKYVISLSTQIYWQNGRRRVGNRRHFSLNSVFS